MKTSPTPDAKVVAYDTKAVPLFKQFTESTTLHGIRNVFSNGSRMRRLIWLLCLFGSTATFLKVTSNLVSSYLSYEVITRVTLVNQDYAMFPAVTICNFNPLRKDYLEETNLTNLVSLMRYEAGKDNAPAWQDQEKVFNTTMADVFSDGGHKMTYGNMFQACTFQERECHVEDFKPVLTRMGLCYTFNQENLSFTRIRNPGDDFGLTLTLSAEQDKYYGVHSVIAGFKLHIHSQSEPPLVKENGFAVMPGTSTFVAVTKKKVISLPAPFKTNCQNKKLPGIALYSKPHCYDACRASFIMKRCGCRDAEMPALPSIRPCTLRDKVECVFDQQAEFTKSSLKNCTCPKPCEKTLYETRLSYAQYPSEHVKESMAPHYAKWIFGNTTNYQKIIEEIYEYMGKNVVQIKVFLQDLNYDVIEDVPKYQLENLLAEAGGMLGLLLGASVLTLVEFFDFIFSFFATKFCK